MTAQINDRVFFREVAYELVGFDGQGLFDPADLGLCVRPLHTACWRGFYCTYEVVDDQFRLRDAHLGLSAAEYPDGFPSLFGVAPSPPGQYESAAIYLDVGHVVPYTGRLLLGHGFISSLYVHMGFHPAWKYRQVCLLELEGGRLVNWEDRSQQAAADRHRHLTEDEPRTDLLSWVESTFERNVDPDD